MLIILGTSMASFTGIYVVPVASVDDPTTTGIITNHACVGFRVQTSVQSRTQTALLGTTKRRGSVHVELYT
jgi:hypothetical protein